MSNKSTLLHLFTYASIAGIYLYTLYNDYLITVEKRFENIGVYDRSTFGGRYKFLTFIDLVVFMFHFKVVFMKNIKI